MTIPDLNKRTNLDIQSGRLLIAEPFLADTNFSRALVFLAEHGDEGTIGFILNRATKLTLGDLLPEIYTPLLPIFNGGPVQLDTLHMIHRMPQALGGNEIAPGIFWGGSFESLQTAILENAYQPMDLRLFVGYAGWGPGQLEKEVQDGAWLVAAYNEKLIFETDANIAWRESIKHLGRDFQHLMNLPVNPQLN